MTDDDDAQWHHIHDDPDNPSDSLGVFILLKSSLNSHLGTVARMSKGGAAELSPPLRPSDLQDKAKLHWGKEYGRSYACNRLQYIILSKYMHADPDRSLRALAYALKALRNGLNLEIIYDLLKRDVAVELSKKPSLSNEAKILLGGELANTLIEANRWDHADDAVSALSQHEHKSRSLAPLTRSGQVRRRAWQEANRGERQEHVAWRFEESRLANLEDPATEYAALEGQAWAHLGLRQYRHARELLENPPSGLLSITDLLDRIFSEPPLLRAAPAPFATVAHMAFAYTLALSATEGRKRSRKEAILKKLWILYSHAGVRPSIRITNIITQPATQDVLTLAEEVRVSPEWNMAHAPRISALLEDRTLSEKLVARLTSLLRDLL